ncbi:non ribosomal peptide synthase [Paramyrothecium foliicola]|nr:non ribosomal peptide synthase [Paramyrothecium foliicola]
MGASAVPVAALREVGGSSTFSTVNRDIQPIKPSISNWIRENSIESPDAIVCSQSGKSWTYRDLDVASYALAERLDAEGLRAGDEIPIFLSRCFESVASIVALLRLGVCFVPMDAESWSQGRVDAVLKAVEPKLVITSTKTELSAGAVPAINTHDILAASQSTQSENLLSPEHERIDKVTSPELPVYIIFTSGTTGVPKGVVIPRRCVEYYVQQGSEQGMPFNLGVSNNDKVLMLFSLAFDAAWGVFFSTLCQGGELILSQPKTVLDDAKICTILPATPTLLGTLGDPKPYENIKSIFLGGESPNPALIEKWTLPSRRIFNCYGPTEATICASMAELQPGHPIVLGSAITGSELLVLDEKLEVADDGELCITGPGLASGYYKNEQLTSQRFILWRGKRVYRTLDRARRIPEGIIFCGREDSMVKNRGYLINIEMDVLPPLLAYPGVSSAASFMHQGRLVAVVTPKAVDTAEMRERLFETHDSFVVPDQILTSKELPRTSNGKVDVKQIQATLFESFQPSTNDEAADPLTSLMQEAVAETLGYPSRAIPMDRSFWDLGGNSLLAVKLLSNLHRRGKTLRFQDLLGKALLSKLAHQLEVMQVDESESAAVAAEDTSDVDTSAPITQTQMGMIRSSIKKSETSYMLVSVSFPSELAHQSQAAWKSVLGRHSIFRTYFDLLEGTQRLDSQFNHHWDEINVSDHNMASAVERESEQLWKSVHHEEDSDVFRPLNSQRLLIDEGSSEAVLLWLMHHSLVDGWSIGKIVQDVQAALRGEELPERPLQFWKFSQLLPSYSSETLDEGKVFWKEALSEVVDAAPLNLPKPAELLPEKEFGQVNVALDISMDGVNQVCAVNKVTPAAVLHAAWSLLLRSYTSQKQVVFGTVFSGRNFPLPDIGDIVGPILNTCPFPVNQSQLSTRAEFLAHVQSKIHLISTHQWSANEAMQEYLPGSHSRVLQTVLFLEYDLPGFGESSWHFNRADKPEFDLTIVIRREGDGLGLRAMYDRNVYTQPVVQRMMAHFKNLFFAFVDPKCETIVDLRSRMLDSNEFLSLTSASSTLMEPYIGPSNLKDAFEMGAKQWPDAVAIETLTDSINYKDLDELTNYIGRNIASKVRPGDSVAIVSDRSMKWLIAVIAVIKAGAVYVPMDTKLPVERMNIMLGTSEAKLCLFPNEDCRRRFQDIFHTTLSLDDLLLTYDRSDVKPLETLIDGEDIAYITFTSGSTGIPKGVRIEHRSAVSYLDYGPSRMDARPGQRHAQMFSPGFDVSQAEIFGTLCYGATLVLADPEDPFAHLTRVNATMITPSFLSVCEPNDYPNLKTILFAGEAVPQVLADRWADIRTVYNSYGPCECTIGCLFQPLEPHVEVTLGKTIPRVGVYLLDADNCPVPIGVPGEICLSGIQIAEGYIGAGMQKQTREKFVSDPFVPGYRMYRTGDSAVWTEALEPRFLGRFDNQVKVRGFRVELTEIENVIRIIEPEVRRAAAVVNGDVIVAFVEPATVDIPSIQAGLRTKLPAYACPSQIVALETLPTMPNQKLDRKALQAYSLSSQSSEDDSQTPLQRLLVDAWRAAIGLPETVAIKANSDFTDLGGSSLSQIRVAQIVCNKLGVRLPLKIFIFNTKLSVLSEQIQEHIKEAEEEAKNMSFEAAWKTLEPPFTAISYLEEEFIQLSSTSATPEAFNVATKLRFTGDIDVVALENAILTVTQQEPIFKSCYKFENGTIERHESGNPCDIVQANLLDAEIIEFVSKPFDLEHGPLSRVLLKQDSSTVEVVLVQHHVITDKISIKKIFQKIQNAYLQLISPDSHTEDTNAERADYTMWAKWRSSQVPASLQSGSAQYWQGQLSDLPNQLFGPIRRPGTYTGKSQSFKLKGGSFLSGSMESYVALVATALAKVQSVNDLVVSIPHIDRYEPGTEDLLGVFLDRLPLRVKLSTEDLSNLSNVVQSVWSQVRDALAHSIPSKDISKMAGKHDLFEVMIVSNRLEDSIAKQLNLPNVKVEDTAVRATGAKFPLLVEFTEGTEFTTCELEFMEDLVSPEVASAIGSAITELWAPALSNLL